MLRDGRILLVVDRGQRAPGQKFPLLSADKDGTVHMLFCLEYERCFYGPSMYSDIAVTQTGTNLCFYGRGTTPGFAGSGLTLARFNLEWLEQP